MGQIDLYNLPNTNIVVSVNINSVKIAGWFGVTYVGGWWKIVIKTHGIEYKSPQQTPVNTAWTYYEYTWTTNPNTGVMWTIEEINALQIGPELQSKIVGEWIYATWCSQIYAEINYTELPEGLIKKMNKDLNSRINGGLN